jgi:hypothetical protein
MSRYRVQDMEVKMERVRLNILMREGQSPYLNYLLCLLFHHSDRPVSRAWPFSTFYSSESSYVRKPSPGPSIVRYVVASQTCQINACEERLVLVDVMVIAFRFTFMPVNSDIIAFVQLYFSCCHGLVRSVIHIRCYTNYMSRFFSRNSKVQLAADLTLSSFILMYDYI